MTTPKTPRKKIVTDLNFAWLHATDMVKLYLRRPNDSLIYHNILLWIALAAKPKLILELGTGPGVSSLAFARAIWYWRKILDTNGEFHTCDIDPKRVAALKRFVRSGSMIKTHSMSTDDLALEWAVKGTEIDLLYIDAGHSYEQSKLDFDNFSQYVRPDGLILMHDTFPVDITHEQPEYSWEVWKTASFIKQNYADNFEISTIPFLSGLSVIRRRGERYF